MENWLVILIELDKTMTETEEKEIIRVCGKDYGYWDIPAYIRKQDFEKEQKLADATEENQKKEK